MQSKYYSKTNHRPIDNQLSRTNITDRWRNYKAEMPKRSGYYQRLVQRPLIRHQRHVKLLTRYLTTGSGFFSLLSFVFTTRFNSFIVARPMANINTGDANCTGKLN